MDIDPVENDDAMHRVLTSLVLPRPIGWISTRGPEGGDNLAPYSYYNAVSTHPPVLMFSAGPKDGKLKHSSRNAVETGEFVANLVTEDLIDEMDLSSAPLDPGESEFDFAGLTRGESLTVSAPRVAAAKACLECTLHDTVEVYGNTVVMGDVTNIYVDETLLTDGKVDTRKVDAVARLGGSYYGGVDVLDFERQY